MKGRGMSVSKAVARQRQLESQGYEIDRPLVRIARIGTAMLLLSPLLYVFACALARMP